MFGFARIGLVFGLVLGLAAGPALAQSLDSRRPTPLGPGENRGNIDNMVGAQFWLLNYKPGPATITVRFASKGLFGNPMAATINVVLLSRDGKVFDTRHLTSSGPPAQLNWPGVFKTTGSLVVEVQMTGSAIVRNGGDYSIVVSGAGGDVSRASGGPPPAAEIAGTYAVMVCAPDFDCQNDLAIRFSPDGHVATTDGHNGTWSLFDPDQRIYSVVIGRDRWNLKLDPGRGLIDLHDNSIIVFQAIRPR